MGSPDKMAETAKTERVSPARAVSRIPAENPPADPATVLTVWYQEKRWATAFLPPRAAKIVEEDGSRREIATP